MNAKEAARRQKLIKDTIVGLDEIVNTGLIQELDPEQEEVLKLLIAVAVRKLQVEL